MTIAFAPVSDDYDVVPDVADDLLKAADAHRVDLPMLCLLPMVLLLPRAAILQRFALRLSGERSRRGRADRVEVALTTLVAE